MFLGSLLWISSGTTLWAQSPSEHQDASASSSPSASRPEAEPEVCHLVQTYQYPYPMVLANYEDHRSPESNVLLVPSIPPFWAQEIVGADLVYEETAWNISDPYRVKYAVFDEDFVVVGGYQCFMDCGALFGICFRRVAFHLLVIAD